MPFIYYDGDVNDPPFVKLLCGCGNDLSRHLWRVFSDDPSAYIMAVNIMHYRHNHTDWDNVWPGTCSPESYEKEKSYYNLNVKMDLVDLLERHKALYLAKGFDSLGRAERHRAIVDSAVSGYRIDKTPIKRSKRHRAISDRDGNEDE